MHNYQVVHCRHKLNLVKAVHTRLVGHIVNEFVEYLFSKAFSELPSYSFLKGVNVDIATHLRTKDVIKSGGCATTSKDRQVEYLLYKVEYWARYLCVKR